LDPSILAGILAKPVIQGMFSLLKEQFNKDQAPKDIKVKVENHLTEIINWSENVQFFEMHKSKNTDDCTVKLQFGIPRKFRSSERKEIEEESDLLKMPGNILIIGDPGAGKTTTLKRISRHTLFSETELEKYHDYFPLLIKLRDINTSIYVEIAKTLGFVVREVRKKITGKTTLFIGEVEHFIGDEKLDVVIPKLLNKSHILLLVDGLDELPREHKGQFESDFTKLGNKLTTSKIILTCRSGGYSHYIDGFTVLEICPLEDFQINEIIQKWADEPEIFKSTLAKYPYSDLANRPLFLNQLIITFNYYGELPNQPSEVYERIINLMLIQWDLHRKVRRKSKYADFKPEKKIKFLSAFAYNLTYKIKSKTFTKKDLISTFQKIHNKFRLPPNEAELVAEEIESHTGIISKTTDHAYEFSHLSLQEFLCALYIVREPIGEMSSIYLKEYPPPVAIAIAISSSPEKMLSSLILRDENFSSISNESLKILLFRLLVEDPVFSVSTELGMAILKLFFLFSEDTELISVLEEYTKFDEVINSICTSINLFRVDMEKSNGVNYYIVRRCSFLTKLQVQTPEGGPVPRFLLERIMKISNSHLEEYLGDFFFVPN
jgi:hypothetical protein